MTARTRAVVHVVLLAGGPGTRLWPLSRASRPKALLPLGSGASLLEDAWRRARRIAPPGRIWVPAPQSLKRAILKAVPGIRADRILTEPAPKNTGPAVALACERIASLDPRAVVVVTPSDHLLEGNRAFIAAMNRAIAGAGRGSIVCLGVPPERPDAGFGYLVPSHRPSRSPLVPARFIEKPEISRARRLIATRRALWNTGIAVARCDVWLREFLRQRPAIARAARSAAAGRVDPWLRLRPESVDHALLEGIPKILAARLDADWDDLGTWEAAVRRALADGARQEASTLLVDAEGSVAFASGRLIALLGVPGVVVVDAGDAILVVARDRVHEVRRVVDALRRRGRDDLL